MTPALEGWLTALEGSDYKQCTGRLHRLASYSDDPYDGFCCLGVACDVFAKQTKRGFWKEQEFALNGDTVNAALPGEVFEWLCPNDDTRATFDDPHAYVYEWEGPMIVGAEGHYNLLIKGLAALNDENRLDFKDIATVVRANMDGKVLHLDGPRAGELGELLHG